MATSFLHGAEVVEVLNGSRPIRSSKTAVIGLVGTATGGTALPNTPVLVTNPREALRLFGGEGTIPSALETHFDEGGGVAIVVNVQRPAVGGVLPVVAPADIVGAQLPAGRTGLQAFLDAPSILGFGPKILLAPGFSTEPTVLQGLDIMAGRLRAVALVDAPVGLTVQEAIQLRAVAGLFNGASDRLYLCYPTLRNANGLKPYSQFMGGLMARVDEAEGFWVSPSNHPFKTVQGMERPITAGINDPTTDIQLLNEAGITSVFSGWGMGIRAFGNRSAAWPTETHPRNFISNRRTADVLHEAVELAMLNFLDRPTHMALIDSVCQTVEGYMDGLIQRGALVDGSCSFDKAANTKEELALGHLRFSLTFAAATPAERITFESFQDISLLKKLLGGGL